MHRPGLEIFPILFPTLAILTFIITYVVSVSNGDVYPYFPTISDTGVIKPESNIFSLLLASASFIGFVVVYIRYMQFDFFTELTQDSPARLSCVNKTALAIGTASCFGALVVATFQGQGSSMIEHAIGAVLTFGGGIIYCALQSYLTYHMVACGLNSSRMLQTRLVLTVLALLSFIAFFALFAGANMEKDQDKKKHPSDLHWGPDEPGFALHVASSAAEWVMAIFLLFFFFTFVPDFRTVSLTLKMKRRYSASLPFETGSHSDIEAPIYA